MDLARAPCRAPLTARKKGSGYENGLDANNGNSNLVPRIFLWEKKERSWKKKERSKERSWVRGCGNSWACTKTRNNRNETTGTTGTKPPEPPERPEQESEKTGTTETKIEHGIPPP